MRELKRNLNLFDIFCIASGAMISSGLFILPSIAYFKGGPSIVFSYFVAGVLMIPSIFSKAELASAMPKAGGTYFFIERSLGYFFGIFAGLANWLSIGLKSAFALVGIGAFLEYITGGISYFQIKIVASIFCLIFLFLNIISIKGIANLQRYLVLFLFLSLGVYIILGMNRVNFDYYTPFLKGGFKGILAVAGMVFISYGGLTKVASVAEDTKDPHRTIPLGMILSFLAVEIVYLGAVYVTVGILPKGELLSTLTPLTHGGIKLAGLPLGIIMSFSALIAFLTTANAGLFSSSRIPLAMAKDKLLPNIFSKLSKKYSTPHISVITTGIFMLILIIFLDLENLVKLASTLMLILFILTNVAVIIMREGRIINYRPTFKSPFYPGIQIFAIISYIFLIVEMGAVAILISLGFLIFSALTYYFVVKRKVKRQSAIIHLVERITSKDLIDTSLEEELKEIIHKRDKVIKDRFDKVIEDCPIMIIEERISYEELFEKVAQILEERLKIEKPCLKELLLKREQISTTVLEEGLAIPHIVVEGENKFEIIIVKASQGIDFPKGVVKFAFVLAGSKDERNFHLRALMAIAQIVREHNFYRNLERAKNESQLRLLILSSTRRRAV